MKKITAILIMLLALTLTLGAADYYMGFGLGYDARINKINSDSTSRVETAHAMTGRNDHLIVWDRNEFALAIGLGGDLWLTHPVLGKELLLGGDIAGLWKKDMTDSLSLMLGGGLGFFMNIGGPHRLSFVNLFLNGRLLWELMPEMSLMVDYKAGYDVASVVDKKAVKTNQMTQSISLGLVFRNF